MAKNLVIVESPAKAKTIEKYLGKDFHVLASVGHIRKDTKVDKSTFDVTYEIDPDHKKVITELKKAVKNADKIWLATDEDREGESIAWHLCEVLKLPKNTARIVFHEITKPALENAIEHPRHVDMNMVSSQQARQTLDMLVGFDLSDLVRKKVPGAISAGRVQSPALRLIVEREREIADFEGKSSFKITGEFTQKGKKTTFNANYDGATPKDEKAATKLLEDLTKADFEVLNIAETEGTRANPVPLTTATLQIEASSKLGYSARTTMSAAQGLYQAGYITYHRTDSLNLSSQALGAMAGYIEQNFGKKYLKTRHFHTHDASAQEAHEAIRPTDVNRVAAGKNNYEKRLYDLIWSRTLATQMANAKVMKTTVKISQDFTAKGEVIVFDGFLKVYGKAKDLELPKLNIGDALDYQKIVARQTFEKPPARYTEGSLVKKLEELGIGRPSTYASIITAIQARGYVVKGESEGKERDVIEITTTNGQVKSEILQEKTGANKGKLVPTPVGELVADFLTDNFKNIVDYQFTANIEKDLDRVAEAKLERVKMLRDFYGPFSKTVGTAADAERYNNARLLGIDPKTCLNIYAKIGKNGGFIQLGESVPKAKRTTKKPAKTATNNTKTAKTITKATEKSSINADNPEPRFAPLPEGKTTKDVTLEEALTQLALPALPRSLGEAPDGTEIIAASGPFGPYLKAGKYNVPMKDLDPYTVTLKQALPLYQAKIDSIIADWGDIMIIKGVYGPYIKGPGRRNNFKIPEDKDPKKITHDEAAKMLAEKPKKTRRGARGRGKKKSK